MNAYCLKCDLEMAAEFCSQCHTPTFDRARVPDSLIQINQLVKHWRRIKDQPYVVRVTFGGRETRV